MLCDQNNESCEDVSLSQGDEIFYQILTSEHFVMFGDYEKPVQKVLHTDGRSKLDLEKKESKMFRHRIMLGSATFVDTIF